MNSQGSLAAKLKVTSPTIQSCNFRYAGRLSNENARMLNSLHEKFATNVASALEIYLAASLQLKLVSLEQMATPDYIAGVHQNAYLMKYSMSVMESVFLLEFGTPLIFPMIDLLLGGDGSVTSEERELTDIDEEMLGSICQPIVYQLERSWNVLNVQLTPASCIKASLIPQSFAANEKLVLFMFEMTVGGATGFMKIVLPTSFVGLLLRQLTAARSKKDAAFNRARPSVRERILDCNFTLSADITDMRVLVKDLIELQPGMHLKMKSPLNNPASVTVEGIEIFQSSPVRTGSMKATQLLGRANGNALMRSN